MIRLNDFSPFNRWEPCLNAEVWAGTKEPRYLKDSLTGKRFFNESKGIVSFKCFLLSMGTPVIHLIAAVCSVAFRALKLASFSHFWMHTRGENFSLKEKCQMAGDDLLRLIAAPFVYAALELTALCGIFFPYQARKIFGSLEMWAFKTPILAPCFQPEPERHALGGDLNKRNAF